MLTEGDLADLRPYLLRWARGMVPEGLEEDLVQETLVYLWEERAHYDRGRTPLRGWGWVMMRAMRNTLVDLQRLAVGRAR